MSQQYYGSQLMSRPGYSSPRSCVAVALRFSLPSSSTSSLVAVLTEGLLSADDCKPFQKDVCMCYSCDILALSIEGHATVTVMCSTSSFVSILAVPTSLELVKAADIQSEERRSLAAC